MSVLRTRVTNIFTGERTLVTMTRIPSMQYDMERDLALDVIEITNDNPRLSEYLISVAPSKSVTPCEPSPGYDDDPEFFSAVFAYALDDAISGGRFLTHPWAE